MLQSRFLPLTVGVAALLAPLLADAQQAQTTKWVNVRAGPAREYPLVQQLPPTTPVVVQGCVDDFSWCDVLAPDNVRGWVYGGNLVYPYQGNNVTVVQYGPRIGFPVVSFVLGVYWADYYRQRSWYNERNRWNNWYLQHRRQPQFRPPIPPHRPDLRPRPQPQPVRPLPGVRPPPSISPPQTGRPPVMRPSPPPRRPGPQPVQPTRSAPPKGDGPGGMRPQPR